MAIAMPHPNNLSGTNVKADCQYLSNHNIYNIISTMLCILYIKV